MTPRHSRTDDGPKRPKTSTESRQCRSQQPTAVTNTSRPPQHGRPHAIAQNSHPSFPFLPAGTTRESPDAPDVPNRSQDASDMQARHKTSEYVLPPVRRGDREGESSGRRKGGGGNEAWERDAASPGSAARTPSRESLASSWRGCVRQASAPAPAMPAPNRRCSTGFVSL